MSVTSFFKATAFKAVLARLGGDPDLKTTVIGGVIAALRAATLDWSKVFQGDPTECGNVVGVLAIAVFAYYTNKSSSPGK